MSVMLYPCMLCVALLMCLFVLCVVNVSVCFVCCVLDSVCELFGETIRNVFGCSCYFFVECLCLLHPSLRGFPCGDGSGRHSLFPDI